nr:hypothetical protein [Streptomyces corallincola]
MLGRDGTYGEVGHVEGVEGSGVVEGREVVEGRGTGRGGRGG